MPTSIKSKRKELMHERQGRVVAANGATGQDEHSKEVLAVFKHLHGAYDAFLVGFLRHEPQLQLALQLI
eukprot:6172353-Pleurochrysis_carterae.AAC.1